MTEKEKMLEQMLHDANDAKELSDDRARAKDLCYDYSQLCPSDEEGKQNCKTDEKVAGRSQRSIVMRFVKGKLHQ